MSNEQKPVIDETVEETQEEVEAPETESEPTGKDVPTLEDYRNLEKKAKTLEAQKEHWKKKAATASQEAANKPPTAGISREEILLITKGVPEEVIEEAREIAESKGISLAEAIKRPSIVALQEKIEADAKRAKAQLGASSGSGSDTTVDLVNAVGMTEEEHRKAIGM